MNLLKKLASQTAIYGLSSVVGRLLNYFLTPLLTRPELGGFYPSEYGIVTEMYAYVAFLAIVLTYGMETAFFRFSEKEKENNTVYSTALISLLISSLIFIGLIFANSTAIAHWIGYGKHTEYIKWFALIIGMDAVASISFAKLREQGKATRFAFIRLLGIFVNIGLVLFFIMYCPYAIEKDLSTVSFISSIYSPEIGVGYVFIANLIASMFTLLLLSPEMIKSTWRFNKVLWKKMMIYALPLLVAGLAGMTNETIDRILLKHLLPSSTNAISEVGLYGAFYKLSIIMTLFIQTFRFAAEPFFFAQEKKGNSRRIYADVMKYFTVFMVIIFLGVTVFYDIIKGFLGSEYHDERGFLVVSILLLANLFLGIYYNLSIWYKLTEKTKYGAYLSIFGAIITITLNFIFIPILGFVGSAWTTLICYFTMTVTSYFIGRKHYPIPYNIKRIGFYLLVMLGVYFFIYFAPENLMYNFLLLIGFIILIFIIEKPKKTVISNPK